jgi:cell division protein FtsI (penicillin-binding protein 3)
MQTLSSKKVGVGKLEEQEDRVPNVKGMLADDAIYLLENKGLKVIFSGKGKIVGQSIVPGSEVIKGDIIQLMLR